MGDVLFNVFVAHKCNAWGTAGCDFSPSFAATARKEAAALAKASAAARTTKALKVSCVNSV